MTTKKIQLGARVDAAVKAALQKAATRDARSLSGLVEKILIDWLDEDGGGPGVRLRKAKARRKGKSDA
jgi:hypothetical protein